MADTRLYELEECVSPQADDILLIEESATQTDKKVKVSSLMPTDAVESAVADWLTAHPEATTTVEDGSITPVKLATSTMDLFDAKANTAGEYDDMTVGSAKQLLSKGYTENKTPYIYRASAGGDRVYEKLIGGTIAWNQLVQNGNFADTSGWSIVSSTLSVSNNVGTFTRTQANNILGYYQIPSFAPVTGHKYFLSIDVKPSTNCNFNISNIICAQHKNPSLTANQWYKYAEVLSCEQEYVITSVMRFTSNNAVDDTTSLTNLIIFDLTQMLGSTIADYIYSLEQATAGAGVAYFRQMFPNDYYAYDSGTLQSVNVASKKVYDSNNTLVATYAFDSDLTLRGIPKLDASNNLYYDGDIYESDGSVTRKYGIVDLGSLEWEYTTQFTNPLFRTNDIISLIKSPSSAGVECNCISPLYLAGTANNMINMANYDKRISVYNGQLRITNSAYTDAQTFKTAMNGVYLVYELATPTTESADAYINPQMVDADGTEEFVDYAQSQGTRDVAVPVGHESKYMINLRAKIEDAVMLPTLPTTNGTYTLKCTVASGVPTLSWVAD